MLAINHATLATALAFSTSYYLDRPFFLPFILFVVFASLLPDIDHPGSEIGQHFQFLGQILPHRGVTHSFVGVAIFGGGLYFLLGYNQILSAILIIGAFFGLEYTKEILLKRVGKIQKLSYGAISRKQAKIVLSITTIVLHIFLGLLLLLVWKEQFRMEILVLLVFGYLAHILGDFVTIEGVPLFWPQKKKDGLRLFRTGSVIEGIIGFALVGVNLYYGYLFFDKYQVLSNGYWIAYLDYIWN